MLNKCKWLNIKNLISYSSLCIIHKTLREKSPENMLTLFRVTPTTRNIADISTKYIPTTEKFKKNYIYKNTKIYNNLESSLKNKSVKAFKKELKLTLLNRPIHDSYD